jgi:hypothetical protein
VTYLTMYDSINPDQLPAGGSYFAGYTSGEWSDYNAIRARFPHAQVLSITVTPFRDADVLDVETGDATPGDVPGWFARQRAKYAGRPVIYANASTMEAGIIPLVRSGAVPRAAVRLWSAHYQGHAHICGPKSCQAVSIDMDGTQWTNTAQGNGGLVDQSLLLADFFGSVPAPEPKPASPAAAPTKPAYRLWTTEGLDSLAALAGQNHSGASTILRLTVQHGGPFDPATASYLDGVFGGTIDPRRPMPAGLRLWVPG